MSLLNYLSKCQIPFYRFEIRLTDFSQGIYPFENDPLGFENL